LGRTPTGAPQVQATRFDGPWQGFREGNKGRRRRFAAGRL
jgi:hypothetical protein